MRPHDTTNRRGAGGGCLPFPSGGNTTDLYRTLDGGRDWVRLLAATQTPSGRITAQPGATRLGGEPTGISALDVLEPAHL